MKRIAFMAIALLMGACGGDELNSKMVMNLLMEHEAVVPTRDWTFFYTGERIYLDNDEIPLFESLRDEGVLRFSPSEHGLFNISLTEEGKKYEVDPKLYKIERFASLSNRTGKSAVYVHTITYTPNSVEEIMITPFNGAVASVSYFVVERTPFYILDTEEKQTTFKKPFKKTSDGWKYVR